MFPTPFHAKMVFDAFDINDSKTISAEELESALVAVGLGDAPKQYVYGVIRQLRNEEPLDASLHKTGSSFRLQVPTSSYYSIASPQLAPIESVSLPEFLAVVKELSPAKDSSDEIWKGFKSLDWRQCGRISLDTMLQVTARDARKYKDKVVAGVEGCKSLRWSEVKLRRFVEGAAEYKEKGVAFDEWRNGLSTL